MPKGTRRFSAVFSKDAMGPPLPSLPRVGEGPGGGVTRSERGESSPPPASVAFVVVVSAEASVALVTNESYTLVVLLLLMDAAVSCTNATSPSPISP